MDRQQPRAGHLGPRPALGPELKPQSLTSLIVFPCQRGCTLVTGWPWEGHNARRTITGGGGSPAPACPGEKRPRWAQGRRLVQSPWLQMASLCPRGSTQLAWSGSSGFATGARIPGAEQQLMSCWGWGAGGIWNPWPHLPGRWHSLQTTWGGTRHHR